MSKPTEGDWQSGERLDGTPVVLFEYPDHTTVEIAVSGKGAADPEEAEANIRLMAAAKQMLVDHAYGLIVEGYEQDAAATLLVGRYGVTVETANWAASEADLIIAAESEGELDP